MGSKGIKPRKRSRKLPGAGADGGWELRNSPYTFEGQIEGLHRFGRGVGAASPRMRLVATAVAVAFILPFVFGFITWLID